MSAVEAPGQPQHHPTSGGAGDTATRFEITLVVLASWLIGGLLLVVWAGYRGQLQNDVISVWHAPALAALVALVLYVVGQLRPVLRRPDTVGDRSSTPLLLAALGTLLVIAWPIVQAAWTISFGFPPDTQRIIFGPVALLAGGTVLVAVAPLISILERVEIPVGPQRVVGIASTILVLIVLTTYTTAFHPVAVVLAEAPADAAPAASAWHLYRAAADGSVTARVDAPPASNIVQADESPDGTRLALVSLEQDPNGELIAQLFVAPAAGGPAIRLTQRPAWDDAVAWSPDGRLIAFQSLPSGFVPSSNSTQAPQPEEAPGGQAVGGTGANFDIWLINADGSGLRQLTDDPAEDGRPAWSPDGTRIVFNSNRSGSYDVWVMNVDGTGQTRLTADAGDNWGPRWSPDGTRIVFNSNRRQNGYELYTMDPVGANVAPVLAAGAPIAGVFPAWSTDGRMLSFLRGPPDSQQVSVVNLATGLTSPITDNESQHVANSPALWSADGRSVEFGARPKTEAERAGSTADFGLLAILFQAILLAGAVLVILRGGLWRFGAITALLGISIGLMALVHDQERFIVAAIVAGLLMDVVVRIAGPRRAVTAALAAVSAPAIWTALYFATIDATGQVAWPTVTVLTAIVLAAMGGAGMALVPIWLVRPANGRAPVRS
jgi:Tol biopolymer transport system component